MSNKFYRQLNRISALFWFALSKWTCRHWGNNSDYVKAALQAMAAKLVCEMSQGTCDHYCESVLPTSVGTWFQTSVISCLSYSLLHPPTLCAESVFERRHPTNESQRVEKTGRHVCSWPATLQEAFCWKEFTICWSVRAGRSSLLNSSVSLDFPEIQTHINKANKHTQKKAPFNPPTNANYLIFMLYKVSICLPCLDILESVKFMFKQPEVSCG